MLVYSSNRGSGSFETYSKKVNEKFRQCKMPSS
jgi:hypothetical protein